MADNKTKPRAMYNIAPSLRTELNVSTLSNFPANAETLYHALIHAARGGHILASGSLGTYYSDTPPAN